jgi:DNA invertase Pin-like site-specific DNA recombinase
MDVRFIAVGNDVDTVREKTFNDCLIQPVTNLMNEFHVLETSVKVRATQKTLREKGIFIGNYAVYGYIKIGKDMKIDSEAAEVVREIFSLKIQGYSNSGIAQILNQRGILCPIEYKISKEIPVPTAVKKSEKAIWFPNAVKRILENPVYLGTLVQGRTATKSYTDMRRFATDKSEWAVFEDKFEPIISELDFEIAADLLSSDTITTGKINCYLFSGITVCGFCGEKLCRRTRKVKVEYLCFNKECGEKRKINEKDLYDAVLKILKTHIGLALEIPKNTDFTANYAKNDEITAAYDSEIERVKNLVKILAEKYEKNVISENERDELTAFYNVKIGGIEREKSDYQNRKRRIAEQGGEVMERYRKYAELTELTREILVTFVEKITVDKEDELTVRFRYSNLFAGLNLDGGYGENCVVATEEDAENGADKP